MSEQALGTQEPAPIAQPDAAPQDMSIEQRFDRVLGLSEPARSRDDTGKFVSQKPAEEAPPADAATDQEQAAESPPAEENTVEIDPDHKWIEVEEVLADGKKETKQYSLNELKSQRMMQADYTRKTQEVAKLRKDAETHAKTVIDTERRNFLSTLEGVQQLIVQTAAPELQNVNWTQLAQDNPAEYVRLANKSSELQKALQSIQTKKQEVEGQQAKERQERLAQAVAESVEVLSKSIPTWSDDLYNSLLKRGVDSYGFDQKDISNVYDHRFIQMLHDAHQYRLMKEGQPTVEKRIAVVPKVIKPGTQQPRKDAGTERLMTAREQLRKTGSEDALARVIDAFDNKRRAS